MLKLRRLLLICFSLICFPANSGETDFAFSHAASFSKPEQMQLVDIAVAGSRLIAAGERGLVIYSDDQGVSWRQAEVPVSTTLTALSFPSAELGWAVGHAGIILHTRDGGVTWAVQFDGNEANRKYQLFTQSEIERLEAELDSLDDESARDDLEYTLEDAIFAEEDAALAIETGPADPFLDVLFLDTENGFAVGAYGMLYRTSDGGENWQLVISGINNVERYHYYAIAVDAQQRLYLSGEAGLLYYSADNGQQWERVEDLYPGSLFGVLTQGGYVLTYGLRGNIFRSNDGGLSWQKVASSSKYSLYGGSVLGSGEIALLGAGGAVLLSSDQGSTFGFSGHSSRSTLSAAVTNGDGEILIVGMGGLMRLDQGEPANE